MAFELTVEAIRKFGGTIWGAGREGVGAIAKTATSGGSGAASVVDRVASSAVGIVRVPFSLLRGAFAKAPGLMTLGAGVVAYYGISGMMNRAAQRQQRAQALEQMAMQQQAPVMSYKNTVSSAETALLESKLKEGGATGFAAAELASREMATQQQASASAK